LVKDLTGQVKEAICKNEWYQRWGRHYLPSLAEAHQSQRCNNFKDPGVQHYGGEDFSDQRDQADEIFCKMPPPKPSKKQQHEKTVASMTTYYNRCGGCFHGDCIVEMADGTTKPLRMIKRGDRVISGKGEAVKVLCVTRTRAPEKKMKLVHVPGTKLIATPWHPIMIQSKWKFPSSLDTAQYTPCHAVYNLLLDGAASMIIEGIECVALAHGLKGPVVGHTYFSSKQVVRDLSCMPGWNRGLIDLKPENLLRDPKSNKVIGIVSAIKSINIHTLGGCTFHEEDSNKITPTIMVA